MPFAEDLRDIFCVHEDRIAGNDNTVRYRTLVLQIPEDRHRHHYVKARAGSTNTPMALWPSFMAQGAWPNTMPREN